MSAPIALISGITGQDGSYLTELLLEKGYIVHGIVRRSSSFNRSRIEHLRNDPAVSEQRLFLHYADLTDATTLRRIFQRIRPQEFYHLAGQSHVGLSFEIPESTCEETAMATLSLLEICRDLDQPPRVFHAASSEVFGCPEEPLQTESTPYRPVTPYGCAKAFAANLCRVYRDSHKLFVCNGIMFNHESPRRGENFVTRKITAAAARIAKGSSEILELGNLDSTRDWGFAAEYVEAMHRILQLPAADDYVLATGTSTSVREFAQAAFATLDVPVYFEGSKVGEVGRNGTTGNVIIRVNSRFYRQADPVSLVGDSSKSRQTFGWVPKVIGAQLAVIMTEQETVFERNLSPGERSSK